MENSITFAPEKLEILADSPQLIQNAQLFLIINAWISKMKMLVHHGD